MEPTQEDTRKEPNPLIWQLDHNGEAWQYDLDKYLIEQIVGHVLRPLLVFDHPFGVGNRRRTITLDMKIPTGRPLQFSEIEAIYEFLEGKVTYMKNRFGSDVRIRNDYRAHVDEDKGRWWVSLDLIVSENYSRIFFLDDSRAKKLT